MATTESRNGLVQGWTLGESGWNAGMDANLKHIDNFGMHLSVKDRDLATPPGSPANGDTYIIAAVPTGAWAARTAGDLAMWSTADNAWRFKTPRNGYSAYIEDEAGHATFNGTVWVMDISGAGVPDGGTTGQVLKKVSSTDGDVAWADDAGLPSSGTIGQVLAKNSSTDGDASWVTLHGVPTGGTTGQVLTKSSGTDGDASWQTPAGGGGGGGTFHKVCAYISSGTPSTGTGGAFEKVPFDAVSTDTGAFWDDTNDRITPTVAGWYMIIARTGFNNLGPTALAVRKNGTVDRVMGYDLDGSAFSAAGSAMIYCNGTTDYLDLAIYAWVAAPYNISESDTYLQVVGPF